MIRLIVTKTVPNQDYEEQRKEQRNGYGMHMNDHILREIEKDVLVVEITEEQFEEIRKEVLKKF